MNATSRDQWDTFAEHRKLLSAASIRDAKPGRSRLCILGAGNANDLDLTALLAAHREVHLVDIDSEALSHGAERQGVAKHPRLRLHGGLDTTAMLGLLSDWTPHSELRPADFDAMASWPALRTALVLPGGFDRVASTCVLTQILETPAPRARPGPPPARRRAGSAHGRTFGTDGSPGRPWWRSISRYRCREIRDDSRAAGPARKGTRWAVGGIGTKGQPFPRRTSAPVNGGPAADPCIEPLVAAAASLMPWRWRLHDQTYLVAGISFRLRPGDLSGARRSHRYPLGRNRFVAGIYRPRRPNASIRASERRVHKRGIRSPGRRRRNDTQHGGPYNSGGNRWERLPWNDCASR